MKRSLLLAPALGLAAADGPRFADRLMPAPLGGDFAMDGYWVWCGSVIRGEAGRNHMFASRWPRVLATAPIG